MPTMCTFHSGIAKLPIARWNHWFCGQDCADAWDKERKSKRRRNAD